MKVLIVDDEAPILEAVAYSLRKEGHQVLMATNAAECYRAVREGAPDLVILDVMLPSGSGFDICRRLRAEHDMGIIMLTARTDETDRVVGLELGADDYMTKPFSMRELVARVNSVQRRRLRPEGEPSRGRIEAADVVVDLGRHRVTVGERRVDLTPKEFALLALLASYPDQVFDRETLLDRVWGADAFVEARTVDVHMRWLREKIEREPSKPKRLLTVRGVGYKFSVEP